MPLWLDICLLGLATGTPVLPTWAELAFILMVGILPILWMQLTRPFCIFSLLFLALRPDRMSEEQLRLLRLFKDPWVQIIAGLVPLPLAWGLWKIYTLAPLASDLSPFTPGGRGLGVLVAAIAFLLANLFAQVPASVLRVLVTPERVLAKVAPYPPEQVGQQFTLIGLPVNRLLPAWISPSALATVPQVTTPQPPSAATAADRAQAGPSLEQEIDDWETATETAAETADPEPAGSVWSDQVVATEAEAALEATKDGPIAALEYPGTHGDSPEPPSSEGADWDGLDDFEAADSAGEQGPGDDGHLPEPQDSEAVDLGRFEAQDSELAEPELEEAEIGESQAEADLRPETPPSP